MINIKGDSKMFSRPIDGALYMFDKGYKLFPIKENGKTPVITEWQKWALSANRKKIEDFGTANPTVNWAIFCGASGLAVIDLDQKKNVNGIEALKELTRGNGKMPKTFSTRTPSQGVHLYYKGDIKNTIGSVAKGIDTRGQGGYVLAPGSKINNRSYEIIDDCEIIAVPEWFVNKLNEAKKVSKVLAEDEYVEEGERNSFLASVAGTLRSKGVNYDGIREALITINETQMSNPLSANEVITIAKSISRYKPQSAKAAADFAEMDIHKSKRFSSMITGDQINPSTIPKRDWIMDGRYIKQYVSTVVAPGGLGKSTFSILDAISIVTGKNLTNHKIIKQGNVWLYNMEDELNEVKRRVYAACLHYKIKFSQIKGLHCSSGGIDPFLIAVNDKGGVVVNHNLIEDTIAYIKENDIQALIVDPFVRTHGVDENSNMQMDKVMMGYQQIAMRADCAINLIHHTRKIGKATESTAGSADSARGASSLINAARIAHTISNMSEIDANKCKVDDEKRTWYLRLDSAKANLQAPSESAMWFKKVSIELMNGDKTGTLELIDMKKREKERVKEIRDIAREDLARVFTLLLDVNSRESVQKISEHIEKSDNFNSIFKWGSSKNTIKKQILELMDEEVTYKNRRFFVKNFSGQRKRTVPYIISVGVEQQGSDYDFLS